MFRRLFVILLPAVLFAIVMGGAHGAATPEAMAAATRVCTALATTVPAASMVKSDSTRQILHIENNGGQTAYCCVGASNVCTTATADFIMTTLTGVSAPNVGAPHLSNASTFTGDVTCITATSTSSVCIQTQ